MQNYEDCYAWLINLMNFQNPEKILLDTGNKIYNKLKEKIK